MSGTVAPHGYRLVTPPDWWLIDLDPDRRAAAVQRVVERQFRGRDDQPRLRRELVGALLTQAEEAAAGGGLELYLSTLTAGLLPITASLVVSLVPALEHGGWSDGDLGEVAARLSTAGAPVERRTLAVGDALRRESLASAPRGSAVAADQKAPTPSLVVDWMVPVPGGGGAMLVLAYSSPLVALREAIGHLFDAVTATLTWAPGAGATEAS